MTKFKNAYTGLPIIGPWISRIGKSTQIISTPCMNTPYVIAQAAAVAAPRMLYSLFGPDCTDDAYDYLRGKGKGHRRKITFATLGQRDADWKSTGQGHPPGAAAGNYGAWMYKLGDLGQKVGWYLALVDSTTEFVQNWSSLVYQYSGCHITGQPYAEGNVLEGGIPAGTGDMTFTYNTWLVAGHRIFTMDHSSIGVPPGFNPGIGVQLATKPNTFFPGFDAEFEAFVRHGVSGPIIMSQKSQPRPGGGHTVSMYDFSAYAPGTGGIYTVEVHKTNGVMEMAGGTFFAYGTDKNQVKLGINPSRCDPFHGPGQGL